MAACQVDRVDLSMDGTEVERRLHFLITELESFFSDRRPLAGRQSAEPQRKLACGNVYTAATGVYTFACTWKCMAIFIAG